MSKHSLSVELDEGKVDAIFSGVNQSHLPGAAVGIALNGRPVYRKGFGLASMELPIALSPSMRMRIGSTTKHFTCLAYLLLCEEGRAALDDPIGKHLPELNPVARNISMKQLMGNVSGLRDACYIRWQFSGMERRISTEDLLRVYRDVDDTNFPAGASWSYNNGGFQLLSAAIERIAGQSFEEVLRSKIFAPVGMNDTLLRRFDNDFVSNSATMHMKTLSGSFDRSYLAGPLAGEGGIASTVDDMLRWMAHMDAPIVGSSSAWSMMKESQRLTNGVYTGYGLGLMLDRYRGVEILCHAGGVRGANSQMLKVPAAGLDVVVLVNRHDVLGAMLANEILDACLPQLKAVEEDELNGPLATGTFRSPRTGYVVQLFNAGPKQIASIGGLDIEVARGRDGTLRPAGLMRFAKQSITLVGDPANPSFIQFNDYGNVDELIVVAPPRAAETESVVGHYRCDAIHTEVKVVGTDDGARLVSMGQFGSTSYDLECIAHGIWRTKPTNSAPVKSIWSFEESGGRCSFCSWQMRPMLFHRC